MSITSRAALVLSCALPLASLGCVDSEGTILVSCISGQTYVLEEESGEFVGGDFVDSCEGEAPGAVFPASLAGEAPVMMSALLINQLAEDQRPSTLRVRSRDVVINSYEIGIDALGGSVDPILVPASGFIPSGTGAGQVGSASVGFFAGTELTSVLTSAQTAVIRVRFFGRTTGGDDVETPWSYYPVVVSE